VLFCLHVEQPLMREAVSRCKILKISLCFVLIFHRWVQGKGTHHHGLIKYDVSVEHQIPYESKF